jgi:hypothetical protein
VWGKGFLVAPKEQESLGSMYRQLGLDSGDCEDRLGNGNPLALDCRGGDEEGC